MSVLPKRSPIKPTDTAQETEVEALSTATDQDHRFKYLVFIGRFQPFHRGHMAVIDEALKRADNVIVLVGSANLPRSFRNPFTLSERTQMIKGAYPDEADRIHCVGLDDALYNDTRWLQNVQCAVRSVTGDLREDIALIGHSKDSSSYYLSLFPHWKSVPVPNYKNLSATPIREGYLLGATPTAERIPDSTRDMLDKIKQTETFDELSKEAEFIEEYKKSWKDAPFPPTFMTADAVVVQSGHILLVERAGMPGRGLWALPGGFINEKETLLNACIRELREETSLKVPDHILKGSRHSQHTFDNPYRSPRGRTITQAFYFNLKDDANGLPEVEANDDAADAFWLPLAELEACKMFEDHYAIIIKMVGL